MTRHDGRKPLRRAGLPAALPLTLLLPLVLAAAACAPARGPDGPDLAAIAALPLDALPPPAAPGPLAFPAAVEDRLPNGLTVVVLPLPGSATVSLRLGVRGGATLEPAGRTGLAQLTAEALELGVPGLDAAELAERVEALGSSVSFDCDVDFCTARVEALTRNLAPTVGLLADMVIRPVFPADEVRRLKGEWLAYLGYLESQPGHAGAVVAHRLLYGEHPYGRYAPTAAELQAIERDDLVAHHRAGFAPRGAVLVVAGDVDAAEAQTLVAGAFGAWDAPLGPPEEPPQPAAPAAEPVIHLVDRPGAVQATVLVGHRGPARTDPGYLPARVADEVLGGGAARRLFLDLREARGLTYGASSQLAARRLTGHTVAAADVRNEKAGEALQALLDHLAQIRSEAVPAAELEDAARYLGGSLALRLDSPASVAALVLHQRLLGLPADEWTTWPQRVRAVTPQQVLDAAKTLWSEQGLVIVVVGDAAALRPQLEAVGKVVVETAPGA
jgi:zinc protease